MSKRMMLVVAATAVLAIVVSGTIWAMRGRRNTEQVEKVEQIQADLARPDVAPEARVAKFGELRKEMDQLTPDQRDQVGKKMRAGFEKMIDERVDHYYALPPDKRVAYMDEQIDEYQRLMKGFELARRLTGATSGGPPGGGAPGKPAPEASGSAPTPGGAGAGGTNTPGPRGNWGSMTPEQRARERRKWLDATSPEQRAKRASFFGDFTKRMADRGLQPPRFGPFGR